MAFKCPKCSVEFYDRLKYCPECGFDFTAGQKRCPKCREQIPVDSKVCPECGLDFEKYSYFIPRLVVFGSLTLIILALVVSPFVWKYSPWLHDKGVIIEGDLRSDIEGQAMVPLFINWRTGERYIVISSDRSGVGGGTDYMNNLIPLPPEVVFHYDVPIGEEVWIIQRVKAESKGEWVQVGRWTSGPSKFGWVHSSNIRAEE